MHTRARSPKTLSRRLHEDQSGAIIILALAFVTVVLALAVSLIELSYTGSASLKNYRTERARRYSADSAMQSAVQMVKMNPTMGRSTSPPACAMSYLVKEDTAGGVAFQVFTPGSHLTVTCQATPGVTDSGDLDADEGGQKTRDVTFTVTCQHTPTLNPRVTLTCGSGSANMVLARARVRYDIDYGIVPTLPNCGPIDPNNGTNLCRASTVRAVVPKIVYWSLKG